MCSFIDPLFPNAMFVVFCWHYTLYVMGLEVENLDSKPREVYRSTTLLYYGHASEPTTFVPPLPYELHNISHYTGAAAYSQHDMVNGSPALFQQQHPIPLQHTYTLYKCLKRIKD